MPELAPMPERAPQDGPACLGRQDHRSPRGRASPCVRAVSETGGDHHHERAALGSVAQRRAAVHADRRLDGVHPSPGRPRPVATRRRHRHQRPDRQRLDDCASTGAHRHAATAAPVSAPGRTGRLARLPARHSHPAPRGQRHRAAPSPAPRAGRRARSRPGPRRDGERRQPRAPARVRPGSRRRPQAPSAGATALPRAAGRASSRAGHPADAAAHRSTRRSMPGVGWMPSALAVVKVGPSGSPSATADAAPLTTASLRA